MSLVSLVDCSLDIDCCLFLRSITNSSNKLLDTSQYPFFSALTFQARFSGLIFRFSIFLDSRKRAGSAAMLQPDLLYFLLLAADC